MTRHSKHRTSIFARRWPEFVLLSLITLGCCYVVVVSWTDQPEEFGRRKSTDCDWLRNMTARFPNATLNDGSIFRNRNCTSDSRFCNWATDHSDDTFLGCVPSSTSCAMLFTVFWAVALNALQHRNTGMLRDEFRKERNYLFIRIKISLVMLAIMILMDTQTLAIPVINALPPSFLAYSCTLTFLFTASSFPSTQQFERAQNVAQTFGIFFYCQYLVTMEIGSTAIAVMRTVLVVEQVKAICESLNC